MKLIPFILLPMLLGLQLWVFDHKVHEPFIFAIFPSWINYFGSSFEHYSSNWEIDKDYEKGLEECAGEKLINSYWCSTWHENHLWIYDTEDFDMLMRH